MSISGKLHCRFKPVYIMLLLHRYDKRKVDNFNANNNGK